MSQSMNSLPTTSVPSPLLARGRPQGASRPLLRRRLDRVLSRLLAPVLDARLARDTRTDHTPLIAARAAWLTSGRHRAQLADGWARIVEDARGPRVGLDTRVPVAREAVLVAAPRICELESALRGATLVAARDVLAVRALLTDGTGPVYVGGDLSAAVAGVTARLRHG